MDYSGICIHMVSSPASAGKTDAAVNYALEMVALGHRIIIAQPSQACIQEWFDTAKARAKSRVPVHRFDTKTCGDGQVVASIMNHLKHPSDGGQVVFMTQQALLRLPYVHRPDQWHLIVDEIPAPDVTFAKHLPHNHEIITSAISWRDFSADNVQVVAKDIAQLRRLADNEGGDAVDAQFRDIARAILSPDYDVYAVRENIERTIVGDTDGGRYPLYLFGLLKPTAFNKFASVTIMGAHFDQSLLYLLWAAQGVTFEPHRRLTNALRFQQHPNGYRVEISYLTEERWSKKLGGKTIEVEGAQITNTTLALAAIADAFEGAPFLYQVNKDMGDEAARLFAELPAKALPHKPHGLNEFTEYDNVAVAASFLPPPFQYRFLSNFGITSDQIRDAVCHETVYQAVMRCSLRNLSSEAKVRVVVTDVDVADWLAAQFSGCSVKPITGVELAKKGRGHRRRVHADNAARVRAHRERKREQEEEIELANLLPDIQKGRVSALRLANKLYSPIVTAKPDHPCLEDTTESDFMDLSVLETELFVGTLFRHKRDMNTDRHVLLRSLDDLIEWLRQCHELTYPNKEANRLISPSLFNPGAAETNRGRGNVVLAWGIWLDIDDGGMPYQSFAKMFPGIRMVIYNTASSASDTRFRVFFPTSGYMMADTYHAICKEIVHVVQMNGYCSPRQKKQGSDKPCHGIDATKLTAENMMYLPCQPQGGTSKAFFIDCPGTLIDPALWVRNSGLPVDLPPSVLTPSMLVEAGNTSSIAAQPTLDRLVTDITDSGLGRNNALYRAAKHGFAMAEAGLIDAYDVQNQLEQAAHNAGLDRGEIKPTIRSGRRNSRKIARYRNAA